MLGNIGSLSASIGHRQENDPSESKCGERGRNSGRRLSRTTPSSRMHRPAEVGNESSANKSLPGHILHGTGIPLDEVAMDDEAELIGQAKAGSMDAFTRLVGIHQARVRAFLARYVRDNHVADDLAQETFFSAFKSLGNYEPGEAPLGVWLIGIARNWALTYLRGRTRQKNHEVGALEAALAGWKVRRLEEPGGSPSQEDGRTAALEKCLRYLPDQGD